METAAAQELMASERAQAAGHTEKAMGVASGITPAMGFLAAPDPTPTPASIARQVIYTGGLVVLSPDPDGAAAAARRIAEEADGYVSSARGQTVVLRVPAEAFDDTMQALGELGLVTDRSLDANDVTEQLTDLRIRLDNLEALRQRLQALLERAESVEDALKIETELGRLTGEIESIKGRLRLLNDRVALSTITVTFNTPVGTASGLAGRVQPFGWVSAVGAEAFGARRLPQAQPKLGRAPRLELPDGFVRFYQQDHRIYAIDRGQVVVKVSRQSNFDEAPADFWAEQIRDRLTRELGVPVGEPVAVDLDGDPGFTLTGRRPAGNEALGYFVGLTSNDDYVYLVEAWGPIEQLDRHTSALVGSLGTLRVSRGWF